jgi:hypothetical protein
MSRSSADRGQTNDEPAGEKQSSQGAIHKNYQGFLAGMFSGIAKLSGLYLASFSSQIANNTLDSGTSVRSTQNNSCLKISNLFKL